MKQSLELKQGQRLAMTPQLQQSIRFLQLTTAELVDELIQAHQSNPVLDLVEEAQETEIESESISEAATEEGELDQQETQSTDLSSGQLEFDTEYSTAGKVSEETEIYRPELKGVRTTDLSDIDQNERLTYGSESLREHLLGQVSHLIEGGQHQEVARNLIQFIDDAGYLEADLTEILDSIHAADLQCTMADLERVLSQIQEFEPVGVGARSPAECLAIQISARESNRISVLATEIVNRFLNELAKKDYDGIRKSLSANEKDFKQAIHLILDLNPHPGFCINNFSADYIVPDVVVLKQNLNWVVRQNGRALPPIVINQNYRDLIQENADNSEFNQMKEQLQNAKWLLSSIEKRYDTILKVSQAIVDKQQAFFQYGSEYMEPMVLRDIADIVDMNISTISRATTGKYMLTPMGIFELKYFFSSHVSTSKGDAASSIAIQSHISKIIQAESTVRPISDNKISQLLSEQGFSVARRTVAKYREQMNIPSSSQRKTLS